MSDLIYDEEEVSCIVRIVQRVIHEIAIEKGWWEGGRNDGECIALMHSELSEALTALRHHRPESDHIAPVGLLEEELADVIIRVLDYAEGKNLDIGGAMVKKIAYNRTRPFKHGGKAF